ncbi:hypothetical protein [Actinoplanes friuliensis]|nr:hypothetical protein [Actinoplanes friuliensis]
MADPKGCRAGKTPPPERLARRLADREADRVELHRKGAERLQSRHG